MSSSTDASRGIKPSVTKTSLLTPTSEEQEQPIVAPLPSNDDCINHQKDFNHDCLETSSNIINDPNPSSSLGDKMEGVATLSSTLYSCFIGKPKILIFGQMLSFFLAGTGAIQSSLYLDCNLSAPTFSILLFYLPLCILCLARLIWIQECHSFFPCNYLKKENPTAEWSIQQQIENTEGEVDNEIELKTSVCFRGLFSLDNVTSAQLANCDDDEGRVNDSRNRKLKEHSLFGIVRLQSSPYLYLAVAFTDVYANYVTILAFKYTTITSVSLFDALAIPSAMIVSRLFVGRQYTRVHLLGVMVCCIGITCNVLQDYEEDNHSKLSGSDDENAKKQILENDYPNKITGDILAILGGILFGINNTLGEVAVRKWGTRTEYLGCMASFASIITMLQAIILEREQISAFFGRSDTETCSEAKGLTLLIAFVAGSMVNYVGISTFLQHSESTFLNLSLLTGDLWAVAFSVIGEGIIPPLSFYFALVFTMSGVLIYETEQSPVALFS